MHACICVWYVYVYASYIELYDIICYIYLLDLQLICVDLPRRRKFLMKSGLSKSACAWRLERVDVLFSPRQRHATSLFLFFCFHMGIQPKKNLGLRRMRVEHGRTCLQLQTVFFQFDGWFKWIEHEELSLQRKPCDFSSQKWFGVVWLVESPLQLVLSNVFSSLHCIILQLSRHWNYIPLFGGKPTILICN